MDKINVLGVEDQEHKYCFQMGSKERGNRNERLECFQGVGGRRGEDPHRELLQPLLNNEYHPEFIQEQIELLLSEALRCLISF